MESKENVARRYARLHAERLWKEARQACEGAGLDFPTVCKEAGTLIWEKSRLSRARYTAIMRIVHQELNCRVIAGPVEDPVPTPPTSAQRHAEALRLWRTTHHGRPMSIAVRVGADLAQVRSWLRLDSNFSFSWDLGAAPVDYPYGMSDYNPWG